VEAPSIHTAEDVERLPIGSTATAGTDGAVRIAVKVSDNAWSGRGATLTNGELFSLGIRRLALGPIPYRSSTNEGRVGA
jgi:hypothetical protein